MPAYGQKVPSLTQAMQTLMRQFQMANGKEQMVNAEPFERCRLRLAL
jgi:hypothetical protein